jgi:hypothetical protein
LGRRAVPVHDVLEGRQHFMKNFLFLGGHAALPGEAAQSSVPVCRPESNHYQGVEAIWRWPNQAISLSPPLMMEGRRRVGRRSHARLERHLHLVEAIGHPAVSASAPATQSGCLPESKSPGSVNSKSLPGL